METTSLASDTEITQIAAVCGRDELNQYILPLKGISHQASTVTGLTCHGEVLLHNGKPVQTLSIDQALQTFFAWLSDLGISVLIAHNAKFDAPRLIHHVRKCKLTAAFLSLVFGFCDTLPMFKKLYPNMENYKQQTLVKHILNEHYEAHNALADVKYLQKLVVKANFQDICSVGYSTKWLVSKISNEEENKTNRDSLVNLIDCKVVSKVMASKIANSGLHLKHLQLALQRGGFDGLWRVFAENVDGLPRITKKKSVVQKICDHLSKD